MHPIKLTKIYPRTFAENNNAMFVRALTGREVSFTNQSINRMAEHRRREDFSDECTGIVQAIDDRNGRDLLVLESVTGTIVTVIYEGVNLNEVTAKELSVVVESLDNNIKSIEVEKEIYLDLMNIIKQEGLDKLSINFVRKRKITNFVLNALSIGADKDRIEEAVDKLLISTDN
jgi:hypothetical protein